MIKHATPAHRVRRALKRLTRDRWMCGGDVYSATWSLARCACASPSAVGNVVKAAVRGEAMVVGMLWGEPVAFTFEHDYVDAFRFLSRITKKTDKPIAEIWILGFTIRRIRYVGQWVS